MQGRRVSCRQVREGFRIYLEWLNCLVTPEEIARQIYIESPMAHPSVVMRRHWVQKVGWYQEHGWPEDYDLWLRVHLAGARFAKVQEVLPWWREHPRRLTRTGSRYSVENFTERQTCQTFWQRPSPGRKTLVLLP